MTSDASLRNLSVLYFRALLAPWTPLVGQPFELADGRDDATCELDDPLHCDAVLFSERRVHTEELGFRQQGGQRVIELVLHARCEVLHGSPPRRVPCAPIHR